MNTQELVARVKDNPKTTTLGVVVGAMYALGDYLHGNQIEPWGGLALGAAALLAVVALFMARDGKPKQADPVPTDPPQGPPQ